MIMRFEFEAKKHMILAIMLSSLESVSIRFAVLLNLVDRYA